MIQKRRAVSDEETCARKRRYDKKRAKKVLKYLRTNQKGVHGSIYKCSVCGYWHLTSWPKKLYDKIKKQQEGHNDSNL